MISTSDLHLLGCHFEQYPDYEEQNLKAKTAETPNNHQETESQTNLGVFHFPIISFGFVFVLLGITCTLASIGVFHFLTHTHHTLNQDMDISTWSARLLPMSLSPQNKSVTDSLMGFAFIEAIARKDFSSKWRNALEFELKLEVEAMPFESAVLGLEDWVYKRKPPRTLRLAYTHSKTHKVPRVRVPGTL
ncbi:hypothetical protein B0H65DRAFT_144303 [Neurospora tetraspora]|uniref:Uncharacterized protein n=1 Tax=Neurospora tetraspora TaxID=94610 RepID=A0AAE0JME7_9PEZI|nr:hypothetical protein B0H65DRAFT_144303 [Neurospora tetraspora]